jgi:hypothetical protein
LAPEDVVEARQRYEPNTAVLITELRGPTASWLLLMRWRWIPARL